MKKTTKGTPKRFGDWSKETVVIHRDGKGSPKK